MSALRPVLGSADDIADLVARAFQDDPPPVWFYPDPIERAEQMAPFWRAMAAAGLAVGDGLVTESGDAVAIYVPPGGSVDGSALEAAGLFDVIAGMREDVAERVGAFFDVMGQLEAEAMDEDHWELFCIAVDPASQGRGLGVALVDEMTSRVRRDGVPGFLLTASETNVRFYEHRGYRTVGEGSVPNSPLRAWAMRLD